MNNVPRLTPQFFDDLDYLYRWLTIEEPRQSLGQLAIDFDEWRTRVQQDIRTRIGYLPPDDPVNCQISLFRTMDYGRLERAHTRTVAWLLNPRETHGFGTELLDAMFQLALGGPSPVPVHVQQVISEYPIDVPGVGFGFIDIFAKGTWQIDDHVEQWVLVVEAKVGHVEGEGQLAKYDAWLSTNTSGRILKVFLTPDGDSPESGTVDWVSFSLNLPSRTRSTSVQPSRIRRG
jgi:hypothetical protein